MSHPSTRQSFPSRTVAPHDDVWRNTQEAIRSPSAPSASIAVLREYSNVKPANARYETFLHLNNPAAHASLASSAPAGHSRIFLLLRSIAHSPGRSISDTAFITKNCAPFFIPKPIGEGSTDIVPAPGSTARTRVLASAHS